MHDAVMHDAVKKAATDAGAELMHNDSLGFMGTCPSNLGTGLRGGVMICLPKLNENIELLEEVCASFDLQPRGSSGEHSAAVGAKWDISNKQRIGFSEVQLVQKMIDGVSKVIEIEEKLAGGATADEIKASLGGGNSTAAPAPAAGGKLGKHATEDFGGKALGDRGGWWRTSCGCSARCGSTSARTTSL